MLENCALAEMFTTENEWISTVLTDEAIILPNNPSAFAFGLKDLCKSRVDILCGAGSTIAPG